MGEEHPNCSRCNQSSSSFHQVGQLRLCDSCATLVDDWPYPQWLKLSMAGLGLLLFFALVHGRKYFEAGKNLYRGEQLVEKGQYAKALIYLKQTLQIAPGSDKGALLTAKAALLSGDVQTAEKALNGHDDGKFEDANKPELREVETLWNHATQALTKLEQAENLSKGDGHEAEAASLANEAASLYPQLPKIQRIVDYFDGGFAFSRKDYDGFLQISEKEWNIAPSASTAAGLASALACKYVVTQDAAYKQRSEEMLSKAKELSTNDKEDMATFSEYEDRILYRLNSRQIITKTEYDRKFRQKRDAGK
jgi:tetratricopeptide (TPR) repeat protein